MARPAQSQRSFKPMCRLCSQCVCFIVDAIQKYVMAFVNIVWLNLKQKGLCLLRQITSIEHAPSWTCVAPNCNFCGQAWHPCRSNKFAKRWTCETGSNKHIHVNWPQRPCSATDAPAQPLTTAIDAGSAGAENLH